MANPALLTITDLLPNAAINQPAVQSIDTDGVVNCPAVGKTDRMMVELINLDDAATVVKIKAGTNPPAIQSRDLTVNLGATSSGTDKKIIGPLESSRYLKTDGSIDFDFDGGASPSLTIRIYRLSKFTN